MRRVYRKRYSDWSETVKAQLRRANHGANGYMRATLEYDPMTYVMLDAGQLIGWALVGDQGDTYACWDMQPEIPMAMFYVKKVYRRQGVGTRLATRIRRDYKKVDVSTYDAEKFFQSVKLGELEYV